MSKQKDFSDDLAKIDDNDGDSHFVTPSVTITKCNTY